MENKDTIFTQLITHKALSFKFDDSAKAIDSMLSNPENADLQEKLQLKNVCAKIHIDLANRLDSTINTLNMSKREFIQYAIIEALDKAEAIMNEVDITEFDRAEHKHNDDGSKK